MNDITGIWLLTLEDGGDLTVLAAANSAARAQQEAEQLEGKPLKWIASDVAVTGRGTYMIQWMQVLSDEPA